MTVKELISKLSEFDENLEVEIKAADICYSNNYYNGVIYIEKKEDHIFMLG